MNLHLDELIINSSKLDSNDLLRCWLWLIKDFGQILIVSKMGDLFYQSVDQSIYWLATDSGTLTKVTTDLNKFMLLLKDEESIDNWFLPSLVKQLICAGKLLKEDQVYSFRKLPVLGGEYSVENIEQTDAIIHFAFTGQISEQVSKLPDGTPIRINVVD